MLRGKGTLWRRIERWAPAGSIFVATFVIVIATTVGVDRLNAYVQDRLQAEAVLHSIEKHAAEEAVYEWEAIKKGEVTPKVAEGVAEKRRELAEALDKLKQLNAGDEELARVSEALSSYEAAMDEEFGLIEAGQLVQAETVDEERVDLGFEALREILRDISTEYEDAAQRATLLVSIATYGTNILAGLMAIAVVLNRQREQARWFKREMLRQSEERFRSLVQNASDIIMIMGADRSVSYISTAVERILGYQEEEIVDTNAFDYIHPQDIEYVRKTFAANLESPGVHPPVQFRLRHADGSWRYVEAIRNNPLENPYVQGIVINTRDVTERKEAEDALRKSNAKFQAVFENAAIGIALVDRDGRVVESNPALQRMLGYDGEELRGMHFAEVTHPDDVAPDQERFEELMAGEPDHFRLEKRYLRKDGSLMWGHLTSSSTHAEEDEPRFMIGMVEDITERKEAEEEMREANRRLRELAVLKVDFTAMVAHEIFTPLAVITGYTDLLANGLEQAERSRAFDKIRAEIEVLRTLVDDVRSAAVEREDFAVETRPMPLAALLEGAARFAETLDGDHPLAVEDSADDEDERVWADAHRIGQVLRNLLSNAAKYSPESAPIQLRAKPGKTDGHVRIEVVDSGPGVHPEDAWRVFEKFGRGRDRAGRKTGGPRVVPLQAYRARPRRRAGVRSRPRRRRLGVLLRAGGRKTMMKNRVLLVDDHAALREMLAFTLERRPEFEVVGQAGSLAQARAMLEGVDLAIVDLDLPDGDGTGLIGPLRAVNPYGVVLVLTASSEREAHARAVEAGAAGVVHKSASIKDVIEAARHLASGEPLLSTEEVVELLRLAGRRRERDDEARRAIEQLTPREREVLQALAEGLSDNEIAERLRIGKGTVRNHIVNIFGKLAVHSRLQALVFAVRHDLVEIGRGNASPSGRSVYPHHQTKAHRQKHTRKNLAKGRCSTYKDFLHSLRWTRCTLENQRAANSSVGVGQEHRSWRRSSSKEHLVREPDL